jgi:hypothetical protein
MTTPRPTFSSPENIRYNLKCENGATYTQLCTDKNLNIRQCIADSPDQRRLNTIFCDCNVIKYESKAEDQNGNPMPTYIPDSKGNMPTKTPEPPPGKMKFYTGRYCQYSDNKNCSGNGIVDYNGKCNCRSDISGYYGDYCQFSKVSNCNGRGKPNMSTPSPGAPQEFKDCTCTDGAVGDKCQYTRFNFCNDNGKVKLDPKTKEPFCECDDGFGGVNCEFTNARCNNNGTIVKGEDRCICNPGFVTVDLKQMEKDGMPTPIPRPTGHCNDCAQGRGPWNINNVSDPNNCKNTWVNGRNRITNDCYYYKGGRFNCIEDKNIDPIMKRGRKNGSLEDLKPFISGMRTFPSDVSSLGDPPTSRFTEECGTTFGGACACAAGRNTHLCSTSGYFSTGTETDQACNNNERKGEEYSCRWGTKD